MGQAVGRREDNVLDTAFRLLFVERLYDGSPRWWSDDWRRHHGRVDGRFGDRLDREPGVNEAIASAHNRFEFFSPLTDYLVTCVNPECPLRTWATLNFGAGFGVTSAVLGPGEDDIQLGRLVPDNKTRTQLIDELRAGLKAMAEGGWDDLHADCGQCNQKQPVFPVTLIKNKWIYVLRESGQSLTPYVEIFSETRDTGFIYTQFREGRFTERRRPFSGSLTLTGIANHTWHFFLSPVRLGSEALALLSRAPHEEAQYLRKLSGADPSTWHVSAIQKLQPWATTVKRRFQTSQLQTPYEFVPLVDAVAWAAEICDFDYLPILGAQQQIVKDASERSKSFIASTLAQVIGKRQVAEDPPRFEEDAWDVKNDTAETPEEFASSGNIAKAWVDRYQAAIDYLTSQTNFACCRLTFTVRFSLAHRIIEVSCQEDEHMQKPDFLGFGLVHWTHILREMLACQAGEAFTTWVANSPEAANRIPQKNVENGENLGPDSPAGSAIGPALPVHILTFIAPVLISGSQQPAKLMKDHLELIGVHGSTLGYSEFRSARNLGLDITSHLLDNYIKKLPADPSAVHRANGASDWKHRIQAFSNIRDVEAVFSLFSNISEYNKRGRSYETNWERYTRGSNVVETPKKVVEFLSEKTQKLLRAQMTDEAGEIAEKLESSGLRSLTASEMEVLGASRSLQAFRGIGFGLKILAGPVGIVMGGCELVVQTGETLHSWESGDPGAAVSHGLEAAAALLIIAVAGAECAALITGAAVAAWAGPIGWIAAGLMLIGAAIMAWCSKNDLELYARHCFLGEDYGEGGWDTTGKAWMGPAGYSSLRYSAHSEEEHQDRWKRQHMALLRMLTGFSTYIGPPTFAGGFIYPTYVPTGAYFEIEVDVMPVGVDNPTETYRGIIWVNGSGGDYLWRGPQPRSDPSVSFISRNGQLQDIHITVLPAYEGSWDYNLRVRLVYDQALIETLPMSGDWVRNSTFLPGIYHQIASSQVD